MGERSETEREGTPRLRGVGSREGPLKAPRSAKLKAPPMPTHRGLPRGERRIFRQLPLPGMPSFVPYTSTPL